MRHYFIKITTHILDHTYPGAYCSTLGALVKMMQEDDSEMHPVAKQKTPKNGGGVANIDYPNELLLCHLLSVVARLQASVSFASYSVKITLDPPQLRINCT